jgi:hypothetical protein
MVIRFSDEQNVGSAAREHRAAIRAESPRVLSLTAGWREDYGLDR